MVETLVEAALIEVVLLPGQEELNHKVDLKVTHMAAVKMVLLDKVELVEVIIMLEVEEVIMEEVRVQDMQVLGVDPLILAVYRVRKPLQVMQLCQIRMEAL